METKKELTKAQIELINKWLPKNALKPGKSMGNVTMTDIAPWSVTDRLNEVFGIGGWQMRAEYVTMQEGKGNPMVVVKMIFDVPEYNIHYECFGGNNNQDLGDAFKGAQTDALTKVASWLGIGTGVWRGEYAHNKYPQSNTCGTRSEAKAAAPTAKINADYADEVKGQVASAKKFLDMVPASHERYESARMKSVAEFNDLDYLYVYTDLRENGRVNANK